MAQQLEPHFQFPGRPGGPVNEKFNTQPATGRKHAERQHHPYRCPELRHDAVVDDLSFDPDVDASDIIVENRDGEVLLAGHGPAIRPLVRVRSCLRGGAGGLG